MTFFGVYIVLSICYSSYLKTVSRNIEQPDHITEMVAYQSVYVLNKLGCPSILIKHSNEPSFKIILHDQYIARVVEGCNGVSMIILFSAFIAAFAGGFKKTLTYIIVGSALIYLINVLRIVLLSIGLYQYPEHKELLHSILFPLIIYGFIFALWVFWINHLSIIKAKE